MSIEDEMLFHENNRWGPPINHVTTISVSAADRLIDWKARYESERRINEELETENARLLRTLDEIDYEAFNTIPPDGKEAAFAALARIAKLIDPYRKYK